MTLDDLIARIKRDLQERSAYLQRQDGARQHINPVTWAHQATTVYAFVNMDDVGLKSPLELMARLCRTPTLMLVNPANLVTYMDAITSLEVKVPGGCGIYTYDNIFATNAPTQAGLLIVENGNELLDNLQKRNKTVEDFYQWSVGFYPLPNLHMHLVLQPH
jgi:hypothetical protein